MIAILDFDGSIADIHIEYFESYRYKWRSQVTAALGTEYELRPILQDLSVVHKIDPKVANIIYKELDELELSSCVIFRECTHKLLTTFKNMSIDVYILSNNCQSVIQQALREENLDGLVKGIQGREIGYNGKPDTHTIETMFCKYRLHTAHIMSLGDRQTDLQTVSAFSDRAGFTYKHWFSADEMYKALVNT